MMMRLSILISVLSLSCAACADSHDDRTPRRHPRDAGSQPGRADAGEVDASEPDEMRVPSDAATATDAGTPSEPGSDASTAPLRPPSGFGLRPEMQTWAGELWSAGRALCEDGRDSYAPPVATIEPVRLELTALASGALSGHVQFGDLGGTQLPAAPDPGILTKNDGSGMFWACSATLPTKGASYTVTNVALTDTSLSFTYAPNEIWRHWCETARPVCQREAICNAVPMCTCTNGTCTADLRATLTVELHLADRVLEGQFRGAVYDGQLRLRRVH